MSQRLISLSPDLLRLREEGYDIEIRAGYLLVKSVPYVSERREVLLGTLVSPLTLAGDTTAPPGDHTVLFAGEYPCGVDGLPIESIRNSSEHMKLDQGLEADHRFSNKSTAGPDQTHYDKMTRYVAIISGPAEALEPDRTARINRFVDSQVEESPFVYVDTASSNAGTTALGRKLELGSLAIVGLGGTGSYVLDLVAKTPVRTIHLFDGDVFLQHNAFRSPGAAACDDLKAMALKVEYFQRLYSSMHRGIEPHGYYIDGTNADELREMDFVFLCLDRGYAKRDIVARLIDLRIPFIDVGMGVEVIDEALGGILTVTTLTAEVHDHAPRRMAFSDADPNADYSKSIQIADLNALNAALAVIKWKKLYGFYRDLGGEHFTAFTIDTCALSNEEASCDASR